MKDLCVGRRRALTALALAAQAIATGVQADMPTLMALYRDLHANPELSMQEVRTAAILAPEARKLGFEVTERVGETGVVAVMRNGPGPGADDPRRHGRASGRGADRPALRLQGPGQDRTPGIESGVMHACGHDTHMTAWIGVARRLAATEGPMVGHVGDDRPARARRPAKAPRRCSTTGSTPAFPSPTRARLPRRRRLPAGVDRDHARLCAGQCRQPSTSRSAASAAMARARKPTRIRSCLRPDRRHAADPGQPRERPARPRGGHRRQLPRRDQAQHHFRRGQAPADRAQLHARDARAAARRDQADRARRGDRRRACPTTACRSSRSARTNTRPRPSTPRRPSQRALALFTGISATRARLVKPAMVGEDFSALTGSPTSRWRACSSGSAACPRPNGTRRAATRQAAVAPQPVLGARRRGGDLDRDRGDDRARAGHPQEKLGAQAVEVLGLFGDGQFAQQRVDAAREARRRTASGGARRDRIRRAGSRRSGSARRLLLDRRGRPGCAATPSPCAAPPAGQPCLGAANHPGHFSLLGGGGRVYPIPSPR